MWWVQYVLLLLPFSNLAANTGYAPWTINATLKSQIVNELAVLNGTVVEMRSFEFDPILFYIKIRWGYITYIFDSASVLLRNVTDTVLFDADKEKVNALSITFGKINATRIDLWEVQQNAEGFNELGEDKAIANRKIWKAVNASVEGIWEALRSELNKSTTPIRTTYYYVNLPQRSSNISAKLNENFSLLKSAIVELGLFAKIFLNNINIIMKEYKYIQSAINSTLDFSKLLPAINDKILHDIKIVNATVTALNKTIFTSYNSAFRRSKLINPSISTHFFMKLNESIGILQIIESSFQTIFQDGIKSLLSTGYRYSNEFLYFRALDMIAKMAFLNSSKYELCSQKYNPSIDQSMVKYSKLVEKCIQRQVEYLPNIVNMFKELLNPFRAISFAPIQSLKSCISHVGAKYCFADLTTTFMANITSNQTSAEGNHMLELLGKIASNIYFYVSLELGSAMDRVESCSFSNFVLEQVHKWTEKKEACFNGTLI